MGIAHYYRSLFQFFRLMIRVILGDFFIFSAFFPVFQGKKTRLLSVKKIEKMADNKARDFD